MAGDELTPRLDVSVQAQILNLLAAVPRLVLAQSGA